LISVNREETYFEQWMWHNCLSCLAVLFAAVNLTVGQADEWPANAPATNPPQKIAAKHLPNAVRVHPRVISGGLPEGGEAFRELASLGVRTIITVDGTKPDIATAAKFGMRYVHLPHGYDGIPAARVAELAKAVRDLPGPIYVHCHHGQHRAPTAAAVGCVAAGLLAAGQAEAVLQAAGTSADYRGLYQSARVAKPIDKQTLDALQPEFPAVAEIPPLAEAMVTIDHLHDRLKQTAAAGWKAKSPEATLQPAHLALLLHEQLNELLRHEETRGQPSRFQTLLLDTESAAVDLQAALKAGQAAQSAAALQRVSANCTSCHREFRDTPLGAKRPPVGQK
jgi:protein tyrosine phosphatase (PTP) superfamily phosphohydrolase (DUF442 family)